MRIPAPIAQAGLRFAEYVCEDSGVMVSASSYAWVCGGVIFLPAFCIFLCVEVSVL